MIDSKSKHIQDDGVTITITRTPVDYTGKAVISKIGKTLADYSVQNKRMMHCLLESNLTTGEMVTCGDDRYVTVVSRKEIIQGQAAAIIAYGLICNTALTVTRTGISYDEYGLPMGETSVTVVDSLPCRADQINGKMRELDTGLLDSTVMKVTCSDNADLLQGDKAVITGRDYRVDDIDRFGIPGAMVLQLSVWSA